MSRQSPLWHQAPVRWCPSFSSLRLGASNHPQIIHLCQLHNLAPSCSAARLDGSIPKQANISPKWSSFGYKPGCCQITSAQPDSVTLPSLHFAILPMERLAQILRCALSARLMPFTRVYEHVQALCANIDLTACKYRPHLSTKSSLWGILSPSGTWLNWGQK